MEINNFWIVMPFTLMRHVVAHNMVPLVMRFMLMQDTDHTTGWCCCPTWCCPMWT